MRGLAVEEQTDVDVYTLTWTGMDGSYHEEDLECTYNSALDRCTFLEEHGAHTLTLMRIET